MRDRLSFRGRRFERLNVSAPVFRRAIFAVAAGYVLLGTGFFLVGPLLLASPWSPTGDPLGDGFVFVGVTMLVLCLAIASFVVALFFAANDWLSPAYGLATKLAVAALSVAGIVVPLIVMGR
jgi:hypothetical protein